MELNGMWFIDTGFYFLIGVIIKQIDNDLVENEYE